MNCHMSEEIVKFLVTMQDYMMNTSCNGVHSASQKKRAIIIQMVNGNRLNTCSLQRWVTLSWWRGDIKRIFKRLKMLHLARSIHVILNNGGGRGGRGDE